MIRASVVGGGLLARGAAKFAGRSVASGRTRWTWKTRQRPGRDGGISKVGIERSGDDAISQVHRITVDKKVAHQHQTHLGKHGSRRQFPDDWVQFPEVP